MAGQAVSSVMQLSTFTKVTSIPREKNYSNFPVAVGVKAPEMTVHLHAPVDVVAVIDISGSMNGRDSTEQSRLYWVKEAMAKVIKNLAGEKNRLAVVTFDINIRAVTELQPMTDGGQQWLSELVQSLRSFGLGTEFSPALKEALKILDKRDAADKERLAAIMFLSDGVDSSDLNTDNIPKTYPIHAFGISEDHDPTKLEGMAKRTSGSYTAVTDDVDKITEVLDQLSDKLTSIGAVDTRVDLKPMHSGVTLSKIESSANDGAGDSYSSHIADDKRSGEIFVGAVSSGKERGFTVYLDVPEGQGSGANGSMDLLSVGGVYTQSWDQKQVGLGESVVAVARPATTPSQPTDDRCKELDWIEERLKYWCNAKQDLSAMYDKAETEANKGDGAENKCECQVTKALREASLDAINKAMHHDIYTAVVHALKLRQCRSGGSKAAEATEDAPSSSAA